MTSLFLIFCSLFPSQASQSRSSNATIPIHGRVLQSPGDEPIRKATVRLSTSVPNSVEHSATTNAQGDFTFDDLPPGRYAVWIDHPGFVQSPEGRAAFISVQPDSSKTPLILHMQPAAVIVGKILDPDGDPLHSVGVTATRINRRPSSFSRRDFGSDSTNDLGEFRISGLRPGRYRITASPPDVPQLSLSPNPRTQSEHTIYVVTYYPGTLTDDQATPIELHSGEEFHVTFSVLATRAFRVSGAVTGIPPNVAISQIMMESAPGVPLAPHEVENGKFEFPSVLPGVYTPMLLTASFADGQPRMQMFRLGRLIEVSNADVDDIHLQPDVGGQVRGKLRLDTGQKFDWAQLHISLEPTRDADYPAVGFSIDGMASAGTEGISAISSDGTFDLKAVAGGTYQLVLGANSNNLRDYVTKSVNLDGRDVSDSGIPVHSDVNLDVVVSRNGASISGTVLDTHGQPVPDAMVVDIPSAEHRYRPDLYQREPTDAAGHFALRGLHPGTYTVLAFEELTEDTRRPDFLKSHQSEGQSIQLEESAHKTITVKLIPATE